MEMNYRQKRNKCGLSPYTISKKLGLPYERYLNVERGNESLCGKSIEEFNEIIKNATIIKLERDSRIKEIRDLFYNGEIEQDMKRKKYTKKFLAEGMNVSGAYITNAINYPYNASDDILERIYDFLYGGEEEIIEENDNSFDYAKEIEEDVIEVNVEPNEDSTSIKPSLVCYDEQSDLVSSIQELQRENNMLKEQIETYKQMFNTMIVLTDNIKSISNHCNYHRQYKSQNGYKYHNNYNSKYSSE